MKNAIEVTMAILFVTVMQSMPFVVSGLIIYWIVK